MSKKYQNTRNQANARGYYQGNIHSMLKNILRMGEEAGLPENAPIMKAINAAGVSGDLPTLKSLEEIIQFEWLHAQTNKNPYRPSPKGDEVDGDIHVGNVVETGSRFGLNPDKEIVCHMLMAGCSGAGKTNCIRHIMRQLPGRNIPVFVPDFKNDYSSIHNLIGKDNLLVTEPDELKFNPLQVPEGVNPKQWLQVMVDIFAQAFNLMVGSKGFLIENINELYRVYSVYEGKQTYPSLFDLYDLLEKIKIPPYSRDARFLESSLGRIKTAIVTLGNTFDCSSGFPIQELIHTNWVLKLDGLAGFIQNFLVLTIMYAIFMYRIANNMRSGQLRHVIILDEGKRIADRNLERSLEIPYTDLLISQIREFETGILLSDQEPSKIAESYKANTYTKIAFGLRNGNDIIDMARSMSLNREQMEYFNKLQVGQAIVRCGRYPHPFIIQVPHVPI